VTRRASLQLATHTMVVGFANNANPRGLALFIVQLVFLVLALVFFLLRCYVKVFMLKKVTLDDWLMAVAVVGCSIPILMMRSAHS
jgi:hypothetical protein